MYVLSHISNCQGLGCKNKHEVLKTDRMNDMIMMIIITIMIIMNMNMSIGIMMRSGQSRRGQALPCSMV